MEVSMFRSTFQWFVTMIMLLSVLAVAPEKVFSQQPQQMPQRQNVDVSDQELQKFSNALEKVNTIQQNAQKEMVVAVNDAGLDVQTYNTAVKQMRNAQAPGEVELSEEKINKVQKASKNVQSIQEQMQQDVKNAIEEEDMKRQRFQQILQAMRTDPSLKQRMQKIQSE